MIEKGRIELNRKEESLNASDHNEQDVQAGDAQTYDASPTYAYRTFCCISHTHCII